MQSIFYEPVLRLLKQLPMILWSILAGILEWFIPMRLYAKDVSKDIVLVTGAGSGLGREIALKFAKLGSSLVLWDINDKGLQETKYLVDFEHEELIRKEKKKAPNNNLEELQKKRFCLTYNVDVSDRVKIQQAAKQVTSDLNKDRKTDENERYVSVLVNNAGIYFGLMFQDLSDQQIEKIFKINILAHFWTVRAFLPNMIKHERGHIVEIASMGGIGGMLKQVDYCATKFATVGFEESLSIELEAMGLEGKVHTTVVCPFFFSSNLFTGFNSSAAPLMDSKFVANETVWAMRCNHSRVLLPKLLGYAMTIMRVYMPRKAIILWTKALGLVEGVKEIKGRAAAN